MWFRLDPSRRVAVAAYLEVLLLIALATAGSVLVFAGGLRSLASYQGSSVSVTQGAIRQGAYLAIESLLVQNTGDAPFTSVEVSTSGVVSGTKFCYTLYDPLSLFTVLTTCPAASPYQGSVGVAANIPPGKGLLVELTMFGQAFSPGSVSTIIVTTSAGSQGTLDAVAVPA